MPFKVGEAYIELTAKGNKLDAELRAAKSRVHTAVTGMKHGFTELTTSVDRVARSIFNVRNAIIALGTTWATMHVIRSVIREANEFETSVARLNAIVRSTGGAAGYTAKELVKMAGSLEKVTTYSDTAIMSAQAIILTFKNIAGEVFERTLKSAMDMAQVMRTDVASAAVMLAKALNEPVMNLGALSRSGVQFNKQQRDMIKTLWESGKQLEAQRMILRELESEFGGVSETIANTFGGSVERLKNFLSDLKREFGFVITSGDKWTETVKDLTNYIGKLTEKLHEADLSQFSDDLLELAKAITTSVITAFKNLTGVVLLLLSEMNAFKGLWAEFQKGEMSGAIEALMEDIKRGHPAWKVWGGRDLGYISEKMTQLEEVKKKYAEYAEAVKRAREMEERLDRVSKTVREGFNETKKVVESAGKSLDGYYDDWAGVNEALRKANTEHQKVVKSVKETNKELERMKNWIDGLKAMSDPFYKAHQEIKKLANAQKLLNLSSTEYGKILDVILAKDLGSFVDDFVSDVREGMDEVEDKTKKTANAFEDIWKNAVSSIQDEIAKWIETFSFDLDGLVGIFKHAVAQMVAAWIMGRAKMVLAGVGIGGGGGAAGGGTAGVGGVGGFGNIFSLLTGGIGRIFGGAGSLVENLGWNLYGYGGISDVIGEILVNFGGIIGAGLLSGLTTFLFSGDVERSLLSGALSAAGFAIAGPPGAFAASFLGHLFGGLFGGGPPDLDLFLGFLTKDTTGEEASGHGGFDAQLRRGNIWAAQWDIPEKASSKILEALVSYYENFFDMMEKMLGVDVEKAIEEVGSRAWHWNDVGDVLEKDNWLEIITDKWTKDFLEAYGDALLRQLGVNTDVINVEIIETLGREGEKLVDTFLRVAKILSEIPNASERIQEYMEESGKTIQQAFEDMTNYYQAIQQLVANAFSSVTNITQMTWEDISASIMGGLRQQFFSGFAQVFIQKLMEDIVNAIFGATGIGSLTDLFEQFAEGEVDISELKEALKAASDTIGEWKNKWLTFIDAMEEAGLISEKTADAMRGLTQSIESLQATANALELAKARMSGATSVDLALMRLAQKYGWGEKYGGPGNWDWEKLYKDSVGWLMNETAEDLQGIADYFKDIGVEGRSVEDMIKDVGIVYDAYQQHMNEIRNAEEERQRALQETARKTAEAQQRLNEAYAKAVESIREYRNELLRSVGIVSPEQAYMQARMQFLGAVGRMYTGTPEAIEAIPDAARSFLQASQSFQSTWNAYRKDVAMVLKVLNQAEMLGLHHGTMGGYSMQHGGEFAGPPSGYNVPIRFHGREYVIPEEGMEGVKKELAEIKGVLVMMRDTEGDHKTLAKKMYNIIDKWDRDDGNLVVTTTS